MATKKRLSDLVREEVEKKADSGAASVKASKPRSSSTQSTKRTASKTAASKATTAKEANKSSTSVSTADKRDEIKALKTEIAQLEKEKKALQGNEANLTRKITSLEAKAAEDKGQLKSLSALEKKNATLTSNLDEAKKDALKLAQENQKLLKQLETATAKTARNTAQPVQAQVTQSHAIQRRTAHTRPYVAPAKKLFSRPVAPARMPIPKPQNSDEFETWCYD